MRNTTVAFGGAQSAVVLANSLLSLKEINEKYSIIAFVMCKHVAIYIVDQRLGAAHL